MAVEHDPAAPVPHPALWGVLYRDSTPFWEAVRAHRLDLQRCSDCGRYRMPPRPMCAHCRSQASEWVTASGRGRVHSWVTYHESPHPAFEAPYSVLLVDLDEGVRVVSSPVGIAPEELEIGLPVSVEFEDVDDNLTRFRFGRAA